MEFVNSTFCESLFKDPACALSGLAPTMVDRKAKLWPFVQRTAKEYGINLSTSPHWPRDIDKWKRIARMMRSTVEYANPSESGKTGDILYVSQGIYKAHFRTAYIRIEGDGSETLVMGCLVNKQLMEPKERPGWERLLGEYNDRIRETYGKGRRITHIREWLGVKEG